MQVFFCVIKNENEVQQLLQQIFFRRIHWNFRILTSPRASLSLSCSTVQSSCSLPLLYSNAAVAVTEMSFPWIVVQGQRSHWPPSPVAPSAFDSVSFSISICWVGSRVTNFPNRTNAKKKVYNFSLPKQVLRKSCLLTSIFSWKTFLPILSSLVEYKNKNEIKKHKIPFPQSSQI